MFEVRYLGQTMGLFRSERHAALYCAECYFQLAPLSIVEHTTGRVIAVWGSSGKRLTFPIAIVIAYVGLAEMSERKCASDHRRRAFLAMTEEQGTLGFENCL